MSSELKDGSSGYGDMAEKLCRAWCISQGHDPDSMEIIGPPPGHYQLGRYVMAADGKPIQAVPLWHRYLKLANRHLGNKQAIAASNGRGEP